MRASIYCKKHPKWLMKEEPTSNCITCRVLWTLLQNGRCEKATFDLEVPKKKGYNVGK